MQQEYAKIFESIHSFKNMHVFQKEIPNYELGPSKLQICWDYFIDYTTSKVFEHFT
jgi:hypothetical protein